MCNCGICGSRVAVINDLVIAENKAAAHNGNTITIACGRCTDRRRNDLPQLYMIGAFDSLIQDHLWVS